MRDIRKPAGVPPELPAVPPPPPALPERKQPVLLPGERDVHYALPAPKTGNTPAAVPVTKIHVPPAKPTTPPAAVAPTEAEKRPLFYKKDIKAGSPPRARIGGREKTIAWVVFGLVALAALLAGMLFLPSARIVLTLRTAPLLVDEHLTLRANAAGEDTVIPGTTFFRELPLEGTSPVVSTQKVGTKARGTVQIVNKASEEQKIKEQSRLITSDGQLFFMQTHAIVPPDGSVTVPVEAAEAGEAGNIKPQRLNFAALPTGAQSLVYAQATQPLSGGSGKTVPVVQESDIEQAKKSAGETVRKKAEEEIRKELPEGWVLVEESWTVEPSTFETTAKIGDQIGEIAYKTRLTVRVLGYEKKVLEDRLTKALNEHLTRDYMLFPGSLSYTTTVDTVDWQKGEGMITVRVTHTTIPHLSLEALRDKLAGRSKREAEEYLKGLPSVGSVDIKLSPFWVQSIPTIQRRVFIDLQPERQP